MKKHRRRSRKFITLTLPMLCFAVLAALFAAYYVFRYLPHTGTAPTIECDANAIYTTAAEAADLSSTVFMQGITAMDKEDGDITASVIIESVSGIVDFERSVMRVRYAVCDSDGNVGYLTRELHLTDYTRPVFSLSGELAFPVSQTEPRLTDVISAADCFDGDVSAKIRYTPDNFSYYKTPGLYYIEFAVSNSVGDTVALTLPVRIYDRADADKKVALTRYLIYRDKDEPFDPSSYCNAADLISLETAADESGTVEYTTYTASDGAFAVLASVLS